MISSNKQYSYAYLQRVVHKNTENFCPGTYILRALYELGVKI